MEQNYLTRAAKYLADLRRRKAWKKVVGGLGTAVVFCTVYALILPAITMTRPMICQLEEHHHTDACYALVSPVNAVTNAPRQTCSLETVYGDTVVTGAAHADFVLHTHGDFCYLDGELICTLPEVAAHEHGDTCYEIRRELICGLEGVDGITDDTAGGGTVVPPTNNQPEIEDPRQEWTEGTHHHSEGCYQMQRGELLCTLEEVPASAGHTHTDECKTVPMLTLVCAELDENHRHNEKCYAPEAHLVCTNLDESHVHDITCYQADPVLICGLEEGPAREGHMHSDVCYGEMQQVLICGLEEGQLVDVVTNIGDLPVPTAEGSDALQPPVAENNGDAVQEPSAHVHGPTCYAERQVLVCTQEQYMVHEHDASCYDEAGLITCGRVVTRAHVHTMECFTTDVVEGEETTQPGEGPATSCGKQEHTHTDACYEPVPEVNREELDNKWHALAFGNALGGTSETVLDIQNSVEWMDTTNVDPMDLETLRAAPAADLRRYMSDKIGIQVGGDIYNSGTHGDMDPAADFSILLSWNLREAEFALPVTQTPENAVPNDGTDPALTLISAVEPVKTGTLTYSYQFPQQVVVQNVEKRVLADETTGTPVLAYTVENNVLTVIYAAPAVSASTSISLRASWVEGMAESTRVQWSNGVFSDVTFASPTLSLEKSMGETGLRVDETDGTVWADYTVTVTNTGKVAAKGVTLTDTLEAETFHFFRGGYQDGGADYSVTTTAPGEEGMEPVTTETFETFPGDYDGGNTVNFPAFDLAPGESRVFQYMAQMSAEDRAAADEIILAEAEQNPGSQPAGLIVSNTATVVCPGSEDTPEQVAKAQATYGGPESKHIENVTAEYQGEMFNAAFTINGDAILPPGITAESVEEVGRGNFLLTVKSFAEDTPEYIEFVEYLKNLAETEESESTEPTEEGTEDTSTATAKSIKEELELSVLGLELRYNSMKLDLSNCDADVTITPTEMFKNYRKPKVATVAAEGEEETEKTADSDSFSRTIEVFSMPDETETVTDGITGEVKQAEPESEGDLTMEVISIDQTEAEDLAAAGISVPEEPVFTAETISYTTKASRKFGARSGEDGSAKFNVVFYAEMQRIDTTNQKGNLKIINTSGGNLPQNGTTPPTFTLSVTTEDKVVTDENGKVVTDENNNPKTIKKGTIELKDKEEVQIYEPYPLDILAYQSLPLKEFKVVNHFNKKHDNYEMVEARIVREKVTMKDGVEVTEKVVVKKLTPDDDLNGKVQAGDTVEMVYRELESSHANAVTFYDYDITDGFVYTSAENAVNQTDRKATTTQKTSTAPLYVNTKDQGINSETNYKDKKGVRYGFGNNNTATTIGGKTTDQIFLNKEDKLNMANGRSFGNCTFGIAANSLVNGTFDFAKGVAGPNIFNKTNTETVSGKTTYENEYSLDFKRVGDTYTLRTVIGGGDFGKNLDLLFENRDNWNGTQKLYTNEFWPMDTASRSYGENGHDLKFGSKVKEEQRKMWNNGKLPTSDFPNTADGDQDHNSYFGMHFAISFEIPDGYIGPLDYCFFGDDDLWLYLESTGDEEGKNKETFKNGSNSILVCDIGGVHSSVGEYVNLRDYITNDMSGYYKLYLFYTERGASGSTCWMQYTLPGVQSINVDNPPEPELSNLRVTKKVKGSVSSDMKYNFRLQVEEVTTKSEGNVDVKATCSYLDANGLTIKEADLGGRPTTISGDYQSFDFWLKEGESLLVTNLPANTTYKLWELKDNNSYETTVTKTESGTTVDLNCIVDDTGKYVTGQTGNGTALTVTYLNTFHYALPETGGAGTTGRIWYTYGALPVMAAAVVLYKRSRKKGGTVS